MKCEKENINYRNISAETLLDIVLRRPEQFEKLTPLKGVRENLLYTIKSHTLEEVTCDDNGAYLNPRSAKKSYHVEFSKCSLKASVAHLIGEEYICYTRNGRRYERQVKPTDSIYEIHRYYRDSKSFSDMRQMIVRIKCVGKRDLEPFMCIVYTKDDDMQQDEMGQIMPHGNVLQKNQDRPYIRTSQAVFDMQDDLVMTSTPSEVYHNSISSVGPYESTSQSNEPRNARQVQNRAYNAKRKHREVCL